MDTTTWTPLTIDAVIEYARAYGGAVHGDDDTGAVDVEFPSFAQAVCFAQDAGEDFGWAIDLRAGDSVRSLHVRSVVLTVRQ